MKSNLILVKLHYFVICYNEAILRCQMTLPNHISLQQCLSFHQFSPLWGPFLVSLCSITDVVKEVVERTEESKRGVMLFHTQII